MTTLLNIILLCWVIVISVLYWKINWHNLFQQISTVQDVKILWRSFWRSPVEAATRNTSSMLDFAAEIISPLVLFTDSPVLSEMTSGFEWLCFLVQTCLYLICLISVASRALSNTLGKSPAPLMCDKISAPT